MGYFARWDSTGQFFRLEKYTAQDTTVTIAEISYPISVGDVVHVRFEVMGTTLRAKVWHDNTPEPDEWMIQGTDTEHSRGYLGAQTSGANAEADWYRYSVGLDGAAAPSDPNNVFVKGTTTQTAQTSSVTAGEARVPTSTEQMATTSSLVEGNSYVTGSTTQSASTDSAIGASVLVKGSTTQDASTESIVNGYSYIPMQAHGVATGTATTNSARTFAASATGRGNGRATSRASISAAYSAHGYTEGAGIVDMTHIKEPPDLKWQGAGVSPAGVGSFGVGYRPDVDDAETNYIIAFERPQNRPTPSARFGERIVLTDADFESFDATRRKNAVGDFSLRVPGRKDLHEWVGATVRVLFKGELVFYGRYQDYNYDHAAHTTKISGQGIGTVLRDANAYVQYENIPVIEAIRDYWDRTRFDADIYEPRVSNVFKRQRLAQIQRNKEFKNAFDITKTEPVQVSGNRIELQQSCFFMDAPTQATDWGNDEEGQTDGTGIRTLDGHHYNGGQGIQLTNVGDYVEFEFSPEYTLPHIRIGIRIAGQDEPEVKAYLDGQEAGTVIEAMGEHFPEPEWEEVRQFGEVLQSIGGTGGQTYTLRLEVESLDPVYSGGFAAVDVVAPFDLRFNYDWPTSVDSSGFMPGPQLYPDAFPLLPEAMETEANIESASMTADFNNTAGDQEIALSNDDGTTFEPERNTEQIDVDFSSYGYSVLPRLTFSRYGSRTSRGPTKGYRGQTLSSVEVYATGSDRSIISKQSLSGSHLANLQALHKKAGLWFTIDHDPSGKKSKTFPPNDSRLEKDFPIPYEEWDDYDEKRKMAYTRVVVQGRRREDGSRRVFEVQNREAIEEAGGDPDDPDDPTGKRTYKHTDPRLETMDDVRSKAKQLLAELTTGAEPGEAGQLTGTIDADPVMIEPGINYYIPHWDKSLPLDSARYVDSLRNVGGTYNFDEEAGLLGRLSKLQAESETWRDLL